MGEKALSVDLPVPDSAVFDLGLGTRDASLDLACEVKGCETDALEAVGAGAVAEAAADAVTGAEVFDGAVTSSGSSLAGRDLEWRREFWIASSSATTKENTEYNDR